MLGSEEYRSKQEPPTVEVRVADCIAALEGMEITIVDVGAQTLSTEAHVYQPLLRPDIPHHAIGFEPLADKVAQRRAVESAGALTLLPYAIGDGRAHILLVSNEDATSSLHPLNGPLLQSSSTFTLCSACAQFLLGHTKLESTVRCLGLEVDNTLVLSEQTDL